MLYRATYVVGTAVFFNVPAHGHINPTLPVVRALVDAGERVVYYVTEPFAGMVEEAGAEFRPYGTLPLDPDRPDPNPVRLAADLLQTALVLLPRLLHEVPAVRADYAVHDSLCPWGRLAAGALGLRSACSVTTFAFNAGTLQTGLSVAELARTAAGAAPSVPRYVRAAQTLRRRYGARQLGPMGVLTNRAALNVVYTARAFQPAADGFDESYQFVGPTSGIVGRGGPSPWTHTDGQTALYVSLGTLRNERPDFYHACFEGLQGLRERVVLSVGASTEPASLGPAPEGFLVFQRVPQLAVLAASDAFVTHGGMNSVHEGLLAGLPLVVYPQTEEQALVGRRVEALGAGVVLREPVTAPALRASVRVVLEDERYRTVSVRIGDALRAAGGSARASATLMRFGQAVS